MPSRAQRRRRAAAIGGAAVAAKKHHDAKEAEQAQQQAAPAAPPPAAPAVGLADDSMAKLKQLGELHEHGVLTDDEFAAEKAKLLGS
jgi:hypothetical protein